MRYAGIDPGKRYVAVAECVEGWYTVRVEYRPIAVPSAVVDGVALVERPFMGVRSIHCLDIWANGRDVARRYTRPLWVHSVKWKGETSKKRRVLKEGALNEYDVYKWLRRELETKVWQSLQTQIHAQPKERQFDVTDAAGLCLWIQDAHNALVANEVE